MDPNVKNFIKKIYKKMPTSICNVLDWGYGLVPRSVKYGSSYRIFLRQLREKERWTKEEVQSVQLKNLRNLLIHAYETTEYYKDVFDQVQFNPYLFSHFEELVRIPPIDKECVQENLKKMLSNKYSSSYRVPVTTGGTSGNQLKFYLQRNFTWNRERAYYDYLFAKVGYIAGKSLKAMITNNFIPNGKLWRYDYREKTLLIDTYHLTDENCKKIIEQFNKEKILFFHAYPSAILILAEYMERHCDWLNYQPKAIFASSENLYMGQREVIERAFGCRLLHFYGHTEMSGAAGFCLQSNHYHIEELYGYMELLDKNNQRINVADKRGEIVVTGFNNYVLPLIRYKTGDYSSFENRSCELEKTCRILKRIYGRWRQEMLITSKGNKISMTALNMHSEIFKNVVNYQFYQDKIGSCELRIVKGYNYTISDEENIYHELKKKLSEFLDLKIIYVNKIEKTSRGKYRYIISKLT